MISRPLSVGRLPSDGDFHLLGLDGEWHAAICPHFETSSDGFTNVHQGFLTRLSLADATRDGLAFGDPDSVFVAFEGGEEFHEDVYASFSLLRRLSFFEGWRMVMLPWVFPEGTSGEGGTRMCREGPGPRCRITPRTSHGPVG
jgi:hypothetical protein